VAFAYLFFLFLFLVLTFKTIQSRLGTLLSQKRRMLQERLVRIGFKVLPAHGTYFLVADFSSLLKNVLLNTDVTDDDVSFCFHVTRHAGVTLIPVSAFYEDANAAPRTLVRFVFCKTDEKLTQACDRLEDYFGRLKADLPSESILP
jgi:aspartate/methionine/tyrosine aminotransferase